MNNRRRIISLQVFLLTFIAVLLLGALVALAQTSPVYKVSGREIALGRDCKIKGEAGTCDVRFRGWINEDGQDGWVPFWEGVGQVETEIDYTGEAKTSEGVTLKGGRWKIVSPDNKVLSGKVVGGTVKWGTVCGVNGYVDANLSVQGPDYKEGKFIGCLDDTLPLPIFIIWGEFGEFK